MPKKQDSLPVGCRNCEHLLIGSRVRFTGAGQWLAAKRSLIATVGVVRDVYLAPLQYYVLRDEGGSEWWPARAVEPESESES